MITEIRVVGQATNNGEVGVLTIRYKKNLPFCKTYFNTPSDRQIANMKNSRWVYCVFALLSACSKESDTLETVLQNNNPVVITPLPVQPVLKRGVLYPTSGIQVNGVVKIVQQATGTQVLLDSFSVSPGPDLKVYLSRAATPGNHINLGNLQSNSGSQYYSISSGTDLAAYPFVLIHCQQYNHLFSYASIQ
jgi:hypothetical protein